MKKVEKITRPFRYDINQIPYDYTVEMTDRFKGRDLVDRVPYIELAKKVLQVCPQQPWKTQRNFLINPTSVFSLAAPQPPKVTWIISPEQAE